MSYISLFVIICMFLITSCNDSSQCTCPEDNSQNDTITKDTFKIVKIGYQVWMTKNLDVSTYRNGDTIRHASTQRDWQDAANKGEGAWCYYSHDSKNGAIYGKLYNWYAVNDSRGLAPKGYHVPSNAEWTVLTDFLGGETVAGEKLKSSGGWADSGNGTNSSGFDFLPGGYCDGLGDFFSITENGSVWSSSVDIFKALNLGLSNENSRVLWYLNVKGFGLSVRCIKD